MNKNTAGSLTIRPHYATEILNMVYILISILSWHDNNVRTSLLTTVIVRCSVAKETDAIFFLTWRVELLKVGVSCNRLATKQRWEKKITKGQRLIKHTWRYWTDLVSLSRKSLLFACSSADDERRHPAGTSRKDEQSRAGLWLDLFSWTWEGHNFEFFFIHTRSFNTKIIYICISKSVYIVVCVIYFILYILYFIHAILCGGIVHYWNIALQRWIFLKGW